MNRNVLMAGMVPLILTACSCSNNQQKETNVADTAMTATGSQDSLMPSKPALSVADSARKLQEKDTARKMIEKAPATVSINIDSIP